MRKHSNHEKVLHPSYVDLSLDTYVEARWPGACLTPGSTGLVRLHTSFRPIIILVVDPNRDELHGVIFPAIAIRLP